ncbi:hypothetical protein HS125_11325 [bacterium]|nr:hypothetical protein [bacterium]
MDTRKTEGHSIEYYVQLYEGVRECVESDLVALGVFAEVCKGLRMQIIQVERSSANGSPASEKQLNFLGKLGVKIRPGLSKDEATRLIDEALERREDVYTVPERIP